MQKVVILDIDETLLYSRSRLAQSILFEDDGDICPTLLREPKDTFAFLDYLHAQGYLIVSITQGVVSFQRNALEAVGILHYFHDIFGWNSVARVAINSPQDFLSDKHWVMMDNLSHMSRDLAEKEIWVGKEFDPDINFIKVDEFWGGPATPLTEYIPKIEELFRLQEGEVDA